MLIKTLTPTQLADIIFQKPERLTKGILERRTVCEKLRDRFLTYSDTQQYDSLRRSAFKRLREKLLLTFKEQVSVAEHPRAFKKAIHELKSLGFSNEQIYKIREITTRIFTGLEHDKNGKTIQQEAGGCDTRADNAFLGTATIFNDSSTHNSFITDNTEPLAYQRLLPFLIRLQESNPECFVPENINKRNLSFYNQ